MKSLISLAALLMTVAVGSVHAADESPAVEKKPSAQQNRMKTCNAEAGEKALKGAERKAFMKECLSTKSTKTTQQNKMKSCNKEAGDKALKGAERKSFMSECLKAEKQ